MSQEPRNSQADPDLAAAPDAIVIRAIRVHLPAPQPDQQQRRLQIIAAALLCAATMGVTLVLARVLNDLTDGALVALLLTAIVILVTCQLIILRLMPSQDQATNSESAAPDCAKAIALGSTLAHGDEALQAQVEAALQLAQRKLAMYTGLMPADEEIVPTSLEACLSDLQQACHNAQVVRDLSSAPSLRLKVLIATAEQTLATQQTAPSALNAHLLRGLRMLQQAITGMILICLGWYGLLTLDTLRGEAGSCDKSTAASQPCSIVATSLFPQRMAASAPSASTASAAKSQASQVAPPNTGTPKPETTATAPEPTALQSVVTPLKALFVLLTLLGALVLLQPLLSVAGMSPETWLDRLKGDKNDKPEEGKKSEGGTASNLAKLAGLAVTVAPVALMPAGLIGYGVYSLVQNTPGNTQVSQVQLDRLLSQHDEILRKLAAVPTAMPTGSPMPTDPPAASPTPATSPTPANSELLNAATALDSAARKLDGTATGLAQAAGGLDSQLQRANTQVAGQLSQTNQAIASFASSANAIHANLENTRQSVHSIASSVALLDNAVSNQKQQIFALGCGLLAADAHTRVYAVHLGGYPDLAQPLDCLPIGKNR
ncbi:hypothetical protein SAMN02745857_02815 [Andreprevotia lacus DSM 23236]|jgi:drug/metabolite transporter (DMT)-like permease|uniref:Uncharacterized protein n=1 Tax=Andreprevotia lacus DSM 23236 TaxID=1121001 RepID=A0A1W1XUW9_9NEIS|nr:hypothetical protein [Andreprevotia lacus]SMC27318.1 hypothetical protein SAMN02745857_02815 [Andreprevotia lacus DSM 23236]